MLGDFFFQAYVNKDYREFKRENHENKAHRAKDIRNI